MAVSTRDVARHAGVSQRTVSNVVNGYPHVAAATRARVQASLAALGYRPNVAARQLRTGRTGTVTLAIPGFDERYFADLSAAVIRRAAGLRVRVLVETTGGVHDHELALINGAGSLLTDGLIMSAVSVGPRDRRHRDARFPLVLVGDRATRGWADHVDIPNRSAARAAVRHLLDTGRRRVLLLGAGPGAARHSAALRRSGWADAHRASGIAPDPALVLAAPWTREAGEAAVGELLDRGSVDFDAVFAMNDALALGALRAALRRGVPVPDRLAVLGFDDTAEARLATPSLSSVSPALDQIAGSALDMIAAQLADPDPGRVPERRHVDFHLAVRESTAKRAP